MHRPLSIPKRHNLSLNVAGSIKSVLTGARFPLPRIKWDVQFFSTSRCRKSARIGRSAMNLHTSYSIMTTRRYLLPKKN